MKTRLLSSKGRLAVLAFLAVFCVSKRISAQTTLTAGDLAFTGYNCNNGSVLQNDFSFVLLVNITAGTTINFTDNGYKIASTNALYTAEGTLAWTSTAAMTRFTQVYVQINPAGNAVLSLSAGSIASGFSNFILSQAGDQVLAYQGSSTSPTFISGIHMNSDPASTQAGWDNIAAATAMTQNRSDVPPGLSSGVNCVAPDPNIGTSEKDNGIYNCAGSAGASLAGVRTAINTPANWSIQDNTSYTIPPACSFSFSSTLAATISTTNSACSGTGTGAISVSASGGTSPYTYSWTPAVGTGSMVSGLTAGTYTVTITDNASAQMTHTVAITATNASPNLTVTASSRTVCEGSSVTLTASGASTYTWNPGVLNGVSFIVNGSLVYTVTGTSGVCSSTASIGITVNPRPSVTANATSTVVCAGSPVTLQGSGATSYTWTNGVANGVAFTPTLTTTYSVTGANANGCTGQAAVTVSVIICPGIKDHQAATTVSLHPNPLSTKALVTVSHYNEFPGGMILELYDGTGRLMKQIGLTGPETEFNREGLSSGIYYFQISSGGSSLSKGKLMIQ